MNLVDFEFSINFRQSSLNPFGLQSIHKMKNKIPAYFEGNIHAKNH